MIDDSFGGADASYPSIEGSPLIAFTSAHAYGEGDYAAAVWAHVTPRVPAWGKPAFLQVRHKTKTDYCCNAFLGAQEFGASSAGPLEHELDPTGECIS